MAITLPPSPSEDPGQRDLGDPFRTRRAAATAPRRTLGYRPALDGLRAVSVIAVLLYHGDVSWMPGGFLGVDVFFVISGFLITTLLIEEWQRSGCDRPAPLLAAAGPPAAARPVRRDPGHRRVYTVLVLPDEVARLRGDVIAALDLHDQLVPDLLAAVVLRGRRPAVAAAPPLVAGGGGAVLHRLADRLRLRSCAGSGQGRPAVPARS